MHDTELELEREKKNAKNLLSRLRSRTRIVLNQNAEFFEEQQLEGTLVVVVVTAVTVALQKQTARHMEPSNKKPSHLYKRIPPCGLPSSCLRLVYTGNT